jgi:hypothetical protein
MHLGADDAGGHARVSASGLTAERPAERPAPPRAGTEALALLTARRRPSRTRS